MTINLQSKDILYVAVLVNALEIGTTIELHKKHDSQVQFFPLLFLSKKDAFLRTEKVHKPDHMYLQCCCTFILETTGADTQAIFQTIFSC